jgi:hypothetical protein
MLDIRSTSTYFVLDIINLHLLVEYLITDISSARDLTNHHLLC